MPRFSTSGKETLVIGYFKATIEFDFLSSWVQLYSLKQKYNGILLHIHQNRQLEGNERVCIQFFFSEYNLNFGDLFVTCSEKRDH